MRGEYTVADSNGTEVTFDWHNETDPTDEDLKQVFAAAHAQNQATEPGPAFDHGPANYPAPDVWQATPTPTAADIAATPAPAPTRPPPDPNADARTPGSVPYVTNHPPFATPWPDARLGNPFTPPPQVPAPVISPEQTPIVQMGRDGRIQAPRPPTPQEADQRALEASFAPPEGHSPALADYTQGRSLPQTPSLPLPENPQGYTPPPAPLSPQQRLQQTAENLPPSAEEIQAGVLKGIGQGASGGIYKPEIPLRQQAGAELGQFLGSFVPMGLVAVPGAAAAIPVAMAAQGLAQTAKTGAGGEIQNPIETGVNMGLMAVLGGMPGAAGKNLVTKVTSGAGIGALQAQFNQAVTDWANKGYLDPTDPDAVKQSVIQALMGGGLGVMHGGHAEAPQPKTQNRGVPPSGAGEVPANPHNPTIDMGGAQKNAQTPAPGEHPLSDEEFQALLDKADQNFQQQNPKPGAQPDAPVQSPPAAQASAEPQAQAPAAQKAPWQMTRAEHTRAIANRETPMQDHGAAVEKAFNAGAQIPPEVLADHPQIKALADYQRAAQEKTIGPDGSVNYSPEVQARMAQALADHGAALERSRLGSSMFTPSRDNSQSVGTGEPGTAGAMDNPPPAPLETTTRTPFQSQSDLAGKDAGSINRGAIKQNVPPPAPKNKPTPEAEFIHAGQFAFEALKKGGKMVVNPADAIRLGIDKRIPGTDQVARLKPSELWKRFGSIVTVSHEAPTLSSIAEALDRERGIVDYGGEYSREGAPKSLIDLQHGPGDILSHDDLAGALIDRPHTQKERAAAIAAAKERATGSGAQNDQLAAFNALSPEEKQAEIRRLQNEKPQVRPAGGMDEGAILFENRPAYGQGDLFGGPEKNQAAKQTGLFDTKPKAPPKTGPTSEPPYIPEGTPPPTQNSPKPSANSDIPAPIKAQPPNQPIQDLGEKIGGARKDLEIKSGPRTKPTTTDSEEPGWRRRFVAMQNVNPNSPHKGKWNLFDSKRDMGFVSHKYFDTQAEAEAFIPLAAVSLKHRVYPETVNGETKWKISRNVTDRKRVTIKDGFNTEEDAMKYMVQNAADIIETKTSFGEEILAKPETVMRTGEEVRKGNVEGSKFMDTFGFRGVEFGNWNNQADRQEVMNHAYDGLLDLAKILKIPPKAVGLNGELGLAFGARGHGLTGARAHYERDYGVINLTKMEGAGALAHEWFHALDHYLGRQDTKAAQTRTENKRGDLTYPVQGGSSDMASFGFSRGDRSKVRKELQDAYNQVIQTMTKKAVKYVSDTQQAEKFVGGARDELKNRLAGIRRNLAEQQTWGAKKNPASAEQLAEFDAAAKLLVDGDALAMEFKTESTNKFNKFGFRGRWTNDAIEKIGAILKQVRGRGGFNAEGTGILNRVGQDIKYYEQRIAMLKSANSGEEKTRFTPTEYAMAAKEIDQGRASDYWTSPHEMAARAFSAYVEDKVAAPGNRSDFLSFGSDNRLYRMYGLRPFPEGTERAAINSAFDHLFETVKTAETDKGVSIYEPGAGYNPDQANLFPDKNFEEFSARAEKYVDPNQQDLFLMGNDNKLSTDERRARIKAKLEISKLSRELGGDPGSELASGELDPRRGAAAVQPELGKTPPPPEVRGSVLEQFKKQGYVSLRGQEARTSKDIASLARVWRNPYFETSRLIFLKDGVIQSHEGFTSKAPGFSQTLKLKPESAAKLRLYSRTGRDHMMQKIREIYDIMERARRQGVDEIVMLHNHPSGDPDPSMEDVVATKNFMRIFDPYVKRHIVIDHDTFSEITFENGQQSIKRGNIEPDAQNPRENPNMPHPAIGKRIATAEDIATISAHLANDPKTVDLIFTDNRGRVNLVTALPRGYFERLGAFTAAGEKIRSLAEDFGSGMAFAHFTDPKQRDQLAGLIQDGFLTDAIFSGPNGPQSVRESDRLQPKKSLHSNKEGDAFKTGEPPAPYKPTPDDQKDKVGPLAPRKIETFKGPGLGPAKTEDPVSGPGHSGFLTPGEELYTDYVNRAKPMEKAQDIAEKDLGHKLSTEENIRYAVNRVLGAGGTAKIYVDKNLAPIYSGGTAFGEKYPKLSVAETRLVDDFALARDALWRYDNTEGFDNPALTRGTAQRVLEEHQTLSQDIRAKVERAADGLVKYGKELSRLKFEAKLWTEEEYRKFTKNPVYIPEIRNFAAVTNKPVSTLQKAQFTSKNKLLRGTKATDTDPPVLTPMAGLIKDTHDFAAEAAKMAVMNKVIDLAEKSPELAKWFVRKPSDYTTATTEGEVAVLRTRKTVLTDEQQAAADKYDQAQQTIRMTEDRARTEEELRNERAKMYESVRKVAPEKRMELANAVFAKAKWREHFQQKRLAEAEKTVEDFKKIPAAERNKILDYIDEGKPQIYVVPVELARIVNGMSPTELNGFGKLLVQSSSLFRKFQVGYNPFFAVANAARDIQEAYFNVGMRPWEVFRGLHDFIKKGPLYQAFMEHGGSMEGEESGMRASSHVARDIRFGDRFLRDRYRRAMDAATWKDKKSIVFGKEINTGKLQQMAEFVSRTVALPFEAAQAVGEASEMMTRLGIMDMAINRKGLSPQEAVALARKGTLDFKRIGAKMQNANALIPFLNARIQGIDQSLRTMATGTGKERAAAAVRLMAGAVVPTIALLAWNQKNKNYSDIPAWEKEYYWIIMNSQDGRGYTKIAKGAVVQLAANPFQMLFEKWTGTAGESYGKIAGNFVQAGLPVDDPGSALPPAPKAWAEDAANYDLYFNRDIVKNPGRGAGDQYDPSTFQTMKTIGLAVGWSPERMQHALKAQFGGTTDNVLFVLDQILGRAGAQPMKKVDVAHIPLLNRFYGQTEEWKSDLAQKEREARQGVKKAKEGLTSFRSELMATSQDNDTAATAAAKEGIKRQVLVLQRAMQKWAMVKKGLKETKALDAEVKQVLGADSSGAGQ